MSFCTIFYIDLYIYLLYIYKYKFMKKWHKCKKKSNIQNKIVLYYYFYKNIY